MKNIEIITGLSSTMVFIILLGIVGNMEIDVSTPFMVYVIGAISGVIALSGIIIKKHRKNYYYDDDDDKY